jgi:hypothetical protein
MKTILFLLVIALWTTMGCAIFQKITTPTVGTYIGTDIVVDGESFRYNAKINKSSNKRHFFIDGIGGFDSPKINLSAKMLTDSSFTIPYQKFLGDMSLEGQGDGIWYAQKDSLVFSYKVVFKDNVFEICQTTLVKER